MPRHRRVTAVAVLFWLAFAVPASAQTTRVSLAQGGVQANGLSASPAMSADGCFVVFESRATNLVAGDTNTADDIFVRDCADGRITRVNVATGGGQSAGASGAPSVSSDGRLVAFSSLSADLVMGDTNGYSDVFVHDRVKNETRRVSVATGGGQGNNGSFRPAISADGRYVAFESRATNMVAGDTNGFSDMFVHDRVTGATTRVSVGAGGAQGNGGSEEAAISADGRYVAFESVASNLVSSDTNGVYDIFVHDRATGLTVRVSTASGGIQGNGPSQSPHLSADGQVVAFRSTATDLVPGDTNGYEDVFVHDRVSNTTIRASVTSAGAQVSGVNHQPKVSADGRYVAFVSYSKTLVPGDTNERADVFIHDRVLASTTRASVASGGTQATAETTSGPALSADGRFVAFASDAPDLVARDSNATSDVFVHDTRMFQRRRISVATGGTQATGGHSGRLSVSANGLYVAFTSQATNLVEGDTNGAFDVFVRDRASGTTTRVSVTSGGGQAAGDSYAAAVSADGRFVAFQSTAANLVSGDTNGVSDVFVHDRATGTISRVSVSTGGAQGTDGSAEPSVSANGRFVAFTSSAGNLVPADTNGVEDVFVHDRLTGTTSRVSIASGIQAAGGGSSLPSISSDGRYVAFTSNAENLASGDSNARQDAFVHDRTTGVTRRVSVASGGGQANGDTYRVVLSASGRHVTFYSDATNLVAGDTNALTDIFVHDLDLVRTSRVDLASDGSEARGGGSYESAISEDGRYVAFQSSATNLVAGDTNAQSDVFVHDRLTGETLRASLSDSEAQSNGGSSSPALSANGRMLAYLSSASNLVAGDSNGLTDAFIRALTPLLKAVSPRSGLDSGGTTIRIAGEGFQPGASARVGGSLASFVDATDPFVLQATTPASQAGLTDITVTVPGFEPERLALSFVYVASSGTQNTDTDGDGLPDYFEARYSLDLLNPLDAADDPDFDNKSNAAEFAAGTHPNGVVTRYLAEGATSEFFATEFALVNPGEGDATVLLRFLPASGTPFSQVLHVPPHNRRTVEAQDVPGLQGAEFSTVLEADRSIVIDRIMRWSAAGYGSHMETGLPALSSTWYLAEGATHSGFDVFYLLQNTATSRTSVQVTFLRPAPLEPIVKNYVLEPQSRFNIWVDIEDPRLANTDVSANILASQPIAVERALYLSKGGELFTAGHQSAGVTEPALSWFLAVGATGPFFDQFVLL
ncbi:MAG: IPT/TIG domain-containing protein, partial [Vicinamibacterales bacterium]